MDGSRINLQIHSATNLESKNFEGVNDCYVQCKFGDQSLQTSIAYSNNPQWFEDEIIFPFENGIDNLEIYVKNYNKIYSDDLIGYIYIPIQDLMDQQERVKQTYELLDSDGQKSKMKIEISIKLLYSRIKYLEDFLKKFDEQIIELEEKLEEQISQYEQILILFKEFYDPPQIVSITKDETIYKEKVYIEKAFKFRWYRIARYADYIFLFIVLLVCFKRAIFLEIFVGLYYLGWIAPFRKEHIHEIIHELRNLILILIFSFFIIDIIWIIFFAPEYWNVNSNPIETHLSVGLRQYTVVMSYLLMIFKIIIGVIFFLFYLEAVEYNEYRLNPEICAIEVDSKSQTPYLDDNFYGLNKSKNLKHDDFPKDVYQLEPNFDSQRPTNFVPI